MPEPPSQQMQTAQPNENQWSLSPSPSILLATTAATDGVMPTFDTEPDEFGLFRSYILCPTYEPDKEIPLDSICDSKGFAVVKVNSNNWWSVFGPHFSSVQSINQNSFAPF